MYIFCNDRYLRTPHRSTKKAFLVVIYIMLLINYWSYHKEWVKMLIIIIIINVYHSILTNYLTKMLKIGVYSLARNVNCLARLLHIIPCRDLPWNHKSRAAKLGRLYFFIHKANSSRVPGTHFHEHLKKNQKIIGSKGTVAMGVKWYFFLIKNWFPLPQKLKAMDALGN